MYVLEMQGRNFLLCLSTDNALLSVKHRCQAVFQNIVNVIVFKEEPGLKMGGSLGLLF